MEADRVRAMLADVAAIRCWLEDSEFPNTPLAILDDLQRKLSAELPPVHGAFAGALNGSTLLTRG